MDLVPPQGVRLTPRHYAYLKISEGCNHRCRFCIIPSMRGDLASRPIDQVLNEAIRLRNAGVRELGQLARSHDAWVRLHYVYPYPHVDDVIPLMAEGRVLPYLDVPFQHASPRILRLMKRPASGERNIERIRAWREVCPDITIRSTFIAGFPGETEAEFEELLDFLREAQLDRVGCFAYSPVEGAAANALPGMLPEEVREDRRARFMQVQQEISAARLARKVGTTQRVLIDEVGPTVAIGRTAADAPEIDGVVYVRKGRRKISVGEFVDVAVTSAEEHDLHGKLA
jgi:ribosomal protein S12 methylthiotransferase